MSTSTPQDPHHRTGAAIPAPPDHPASPGPDPDDLDQREDDTPRDDRDAAGEARRVSPTSPGPNPDDLDDDLS